MAHQFDAIRKFILKGDSHYNIVVVIYLKTLLLTWKILGDGHHGQNYCTITLGPHVGESSGLNSC